jgi:alkanesulfonate monooxygenase SsuD/methylene tetrahydromethanopterin reductase-like flavin-dependent oxidoreductase (luciferase family)
MQASELKIGIFLPNWTAALDGETPSAAEIVQFAQYCEQTGFDTVWLADHFYFEPYDDYRVIGVQFPDELAGVKFGSWECWSLMSAIAVATSSVGIGTLVSNTGFRNPALFARVVATVDDLSEGRVILGLGAGDFATEHRAFGFPFERRVSRFEEALAIIKPLLRGERVSFDGEFYQAHEAELLPKAGRAGGPAVLIGTLMGGPRMSRLVAQQADMWNCNLAFGDSGPEAYLAAWAPIAHACEKHGRDPESLVRHATVGVNLGDGPFSAPGSAPFCGSITDIADRFRAYAALDVEHISIVLEPATYASLDRFGDVLAQLRG